MVRPRLGATYRVQLGPELTFADVSARVGYLAELGVECLYCSPILEAVPGSPHGYDGTDPTRIRAELGGQAGFELLARSLRDAGLGCMVDIVPNHLSTWSQGPWWRDLLRGGTDSPFADVFDVDWAAGDGRVTLPLLDRPLDEALAAGLVTLLRSDASGCDGALCVGETTLPLRAGSVRTGDDLREVLAAQAYRLVDWHDRADRNYRRFFDVDGLVGVRVERPEVFARTHALIGSLVERGLVTALRVDHVDGLARPEGYLHDLERLTGGIPVVVEKILTGDETLRRSWPTAGTTGYEVVDDIGGALVDPDGMVALAEAAEHEGEQAVVACATAARRRVAVESFSAELRRLAVQLEVGEDALVEMTACLPVYRTYIDDGPVHPEDAAALETASAQCAGDANGVVAALIDPGHRPGCARWQQLTGAIMAKGLEDTAWYRLPGRLAFCEVGGDPARRRDDGPARLHSRAAARARDGRAGLVPSSTHDTKRSGDARARLYALTELARPFEHGLRRFRSLLEVAVDTSAGAGNASGAEDLVGRVRELAETLLALVPADPSEPVDALVPRVETAVVKGAREAKLTTSWDRPDTGYELLLGRLVAAALADDAQLLREAFAGLLADVARLAATLSLSSVVLRSVVPGAPDCYQGDEVWNLSLVDPDNRRTIDVGPLARRLSELTGPCGALSPSPGPGAAARVRSRWRDGDVKLLVTSAALRARRTRPAAFALDAPYRPLSVLGDAAPSVLCLSRDDEEGEPGLVAVVTRRASLLQALPGDLPAGQHSYGSTRIALGTTRPTTFVDTLTGRHVDAIEGQLDAADVLAELPVALLAPLWPRRVREGASS